MKCLLLRRPPSILEAATNWEPPARSRQLGSSNDRKLSPGRSCVCVMAATPQETLRRLWLGGTRGTLCAREQARVWGLREAWNEEQDSTYGLHEHIRQKVKKIGGGHPTGGAVKKLLQKIDEDGDWFPGKQYGEKRGRKRVLVGPKATAIASSAKAQKTSGGEPTYASILAACPAASVNPATGEPVNKKAVYTVLRELCYDETPERTWSHQIRFARQALTEKQMEKRLAWGRYMQGLPHTPNWYYKALIWCDLCNSILPRTEQKAQELALARKGRKGWMSDGSQGRPCNVRGNRDTLKQSSWGTIRVWWVPILARGKLHVELMPEGFPGETEEGARAMVARVRAAVNVRFPGGEAPKVLFTDRGPGFFHPGTGGITGAYKAGLRDHNLRAFHGDDASIQPGHLQEIMLHETAVAWCRYKLARCVPARPWLESVEEYGTRLKKVVAEINAEHNVDGLCRELPGRVAELVAAKGGRLAK